MSRRTPWTVTVLTLVGACLTACAQVPDTGPVVVADVPDQVAPIDNPYNNPPPPQPGSSSAEIVTGFLDAMTAIPLQTRVAVKYLTAAAASAWKPQNGGVVAYTGLGPAPHGTRDGPDPATRRRPHRSVGSVAGSRGPGRLPAVLPDAEGAR